MLYYILMKSFNQPYSEIKDIPIKDVLFFVNYDSAMQDYINQKNKGR